MNVKLIAMGNVLMKDDGIGIFIAKAMEEALKAKGIDVIYGETDFGYCISKVKEQDTLVILDAANYGKTPGDITKLPLNNCFSDKKSHTQHSYHLLDILKLYYPELAGDILAIEIKEITFGFGLTQELQKKKKDIIKEVFDHLDLLQEKERC
ncbi:hydrogenase maturation protease [Anaerocolumna sp. AGMB13025]|uniref:hydrogenase maturation protease n=1 Tax=Anaerocolumna sp. AGMB13025 TaxID=3039116 RepID=UPI00241EDEB3|nr:hydrogenase maturation protease [Anaerocolumna sp. AGMB13025]WFR58490.1 hydrogenase maturation protease [Anaerocolumna sp. AGMB13025]